MYHSIICGLMSSSSMTLLKLRLTSLLDTRNIEEIVPSLIFNKENLIFH